MSDRQAIIVDKKDNINVVIDSIYGNLIPGPKGDAGPTPDLSLINNDINNLQIDVSTIKNDVSTIQNSISIINQADYGYYSWLPYIENDTENGLSYINRAGRVRCFGHFAFIYCEMQIQHTNPLPDSMVLLKGLDFSKYGPIYTEQYSGDIVHCSGISNLPDSGLDVYAVMADGYFYFYLSKMNAGPYTFKLSNLDNYSVIGFTVIANLK